MPNQPLIESLRNAPLDIGVVDPDPRGQFRRWFHEAQDAEVRQPDAMHLATVREDGSPAGRFVLYKDPEKYALGVSWFPFFSHTDSPKAREMGGNPRVAATFYWEELGRQVRIQGGVEALSDEASDRYFAGRPERSQLGAWASAQSEIIDSREALMEAFDRFREKFQGQPIPRPPGWCGFHITPHLIEFWQHRDDRLHDRIRYAQGEGDAWAIQRLAP
jgi:pyridoxamine 5'-phosphate oxidase